MRIKLVCFTDRGQALGKVLERKLGDSGDEAHLTRCGGGMPLRKWVAEHFRAADALIFIGATGIAVRSIASEIVSKASDPAVLVADEHGRFVISLLSGHIGGANELTEKIAKLIDATPVVTTATDINQVFAIDAWASRNGLAIINPEKIKTISSRLLAGGDVKLWSPFFPASPLPEGIRFANKDFDILIDIRTPPSSGALALVPRAAALGVGCRKNTPAESIEEAFTRFCESTGIHPEAFAKVCSIDLKRNEAGLLAFCEKRHLPLETFSAETLMKAKGEFAGSDFVGAATGADNVCERSAVVGSGGRLVAGKTAVKGVTMAAALGDCALNFHDDGKRL